jgi:predicted ATPase
MKIKNLEIENFKCFGQKQSLDFGRITLLTGANSSGKSSLMYAILACMQSNSFPFMLSLNGDYVNMGDFEETVFRNDDTKEILIKISLENNLLNQYNFYTVWKADKNIQPYIEKLSVQVGEIKLVLIKQLNYYKLKLFMDSEKEQNPNLSYFFNKFEHLFRNIPIQYISNPEFFLEFNKVAEHIFKTNDGVITIHNFEKFINGKEVKTGTDLFMEFIRAYILNSIHQDIKQNFNYCGAFRLSPQRGYLEKTQIVPKLAVSGEGYLDQILVWETEKSEKFKALKAIMKSLVLTHDIKSKRSKGGKFEVLVKTKSNSVFSSLTDVGFGISNFLPIIVADLQLSDNSTLFISQPETHLHPSVQSKFSEYLSSQINNTDKNYVVETHSEYLLNRIRLAIVKGEVKSDDVKVYYIEPDGIDRKIHHITFAKNGQILDAPKSFFDTYMIDVMNIALHATAE